MVLSIVKGNIIDAEVDAIVLPANTKLKEGSGTSRAIFEAAGRKALTKKCKEIGFCEIGSAVPTLGYDLDCKAIIHAVVPSWIDGHHDEYSLLSSAYLSSLEVADILECKSIAFPLLSAGNNGFDVELAFEIAVKSIESHVPKTIEKVILVVYENRIADIAKGRGYEVSLLVRDLGKDVEELKEKERKEELREQRNLAVKAFVENQFAHAMDYIKDPENMKKIINTGIEIVKTVYGTMKTDDE
ncbi:O-acetyl-ADP-ribose deacetylase (regulator of RNase III), contains Macro domain [Lachnospiraceae bacterium XBB2008]|nr:O-acetyl-ADP-ribose deacetylase (regulator of RNase III), contains Macro domain [Lachnospiraceae bacterium XBB2008]